MAATIQSLTNGLDTIGATAYLSKLNIKAIAETKALLINTSKIKGALEAGWVGKAELNFEQNLDNSVNKICQALDELEQAFNSQFATLQQSFMENDENLIKVVE